MICSNCGAELPENAKFCRKCGSVVEETNVKEDFIEEEITEPKIKPSMKKPNKKKFDSKEIAIKLYKAKKHRRNFIISLLINILLIGGVVALFVTELAYFNFEGIPVLEKLTPRKIVEENSDAVSTSNKISIDKEDKIANQSNSDEKVFVEKINLKDSSITLSENASYKIEFELLPNNASNKQLFWASSDESIVKVDESGNVECLKAGEAVITVSNQDRNISETCTISVEEISFLENLNYDMTNQRNTHASKPILLSSEYIYFNKSGKLMRSNHDGSDQIQITDIIANDSEIAIIDDYIYFFGKKEESEFLYKVKSDGSQQAKLIIDIRAIGMELGNKYYEEELKRAHKLKCYGLATYRGKLYFNYSLLYQYDTYYLSKGRCEVSWQVGTYNPITGSFTAEHRKAFGGGLKMPVSTWHYFDQTWLGSGSLFYTDTFDSGFFKKDINQEPTLLSNVAPKNILSTDEHIYYIDMDYSTLNRMTLDGTLPEKLHDNVSYYTMTDSEQIIFVSGEKVYSVDKDFKTQPQLITEGVQTFSYAGDYLYYNKPDQSIWRVVVETGEHEQVINGIES